MTPSRRRTLVVVVLGGLLPFAVFVSMLLLRAMVFEVVTIPQNGMFPTYRARSRMVISKWRPVAQRGEVVLFFTPDHPEVMFVQRVIAKDGDVLRVQDGHPSINGFSVPSCDIGDDAYVDDSGVRHEGTIAIEFLEGHEYLVFFERHAPRAAAKDIVAKKGELLVLGDNRLESWDSRDFGGVTHVRGKPWSEAAVTVPPRLKASLEACLAKRPPRDRTVPPPP